MYCSAFINKQQNDVSEWERREQPGSVVKERSSDVETVIQCPKYHLLGTSKQEEPRDLQWASWHVSGIVQNSILIQKELTIDCCVLNLT